MTGHNHLLPSITAERANEQRHVASFQSQGHY